MVPTLTPPSIGFPPSHRLSLHFKPSFTGRNPRKSTIHAAAAAVETRKAAGSLYDVLRVRRNASPMEIKAAYWSLAKQYHPDASRTSDDDGRDFIEIHDAYATLSDPTARALYDLSLSDDGSMRTREFGHNRSGFYATRKWETDQCW